MFNIGFSELAIICIVLIIAVGPERLPSMMKTLGKTIRTLRQASRDIRASTGIDEYFAESVRAYVEANDAASFWPRATRERLRRIDPGMFSYVEHLFSLKFSRAA